MLPMYLCLYVYSITGKERQAGRENPEKRGNDQ